MADSKRLIDQHEVGAVLLACIDFRFREGLTHAINQTFGITAWDEIKLAGGAKNISMPGKEGRMESVLNDLELAISTHRIKTILLLNHQDCGKYASEGYVFSDLPTEHIFHEQELRNAGGLIKKKFPDAAILLGYAYLDPNDQVRIDPVKP